MMGDAGMFYTLSNYFLEVRGKIIIMFTKFLCKISTSPILVLIKYASSFKGLNF